MSQKVAATKLIQTTLSPIPPFHQSTEYLTSCPTFYAEAVIKGNKMPGGMESARGNEVHRTGSSYLSYCAIKKVSMDIGEFDNLSKGAGPVAAKILAGMREMEVDFAHLVATELPMSLDENFNPTDISESINGVCADSGRSAHYSGTLDGLYAFSEDLRMQIDDLKTHPRPFDPSETLQAKTYCLFVLRHFSWVQTVTFRLIFVRYKNLVRTVTYTRDDLPTLIDAVRSGRERQKMIHADYDDGKTLDAIAGSHCIYCPLLSNATCPIAKWNPQMQLTAEQRLNFNLFFSQFSKSNNKAMKEYVQETGRNIALKDFNGKAYTFGPQASDSYVYPLFKADANGIEIDVQDRPIMPIVDLLMDYAHADPGDTAWMGKIKISSTSIKSYLKTSKREFLDHAVDDIVETVTKVKMKVSKPLETLPDDEFDDEDEEEF